MRRRDVITLIIGTAAWPLGANGQQPEPPVVGYLGPTSEGRGLPAFRRGLSEAGFVEGRNVAIARPRPLEQPLSSRRNPVPMTGNHPLLPISTR